MIKTILREVIGIKYFIRDERGSEQKCTISSQSCMILSQKCTITSQSCVISSQICMILSQICTILSLICMISATRSRTAPQSQRRHPLPKQKNRPQKTCFHSISRITTSAYAPPCGRLPTEMDPLCFLTITLAIYRPRPKFEPDREESSR